MAVASAASCAKSIVKKLLVVSPPIRNFSVRSSSSSSWGTKASKTSKKDILKHKAAADSLLKRRTRSDRQLHDKLLFYGGVNDSSSPPPPHLPVLLGEVLDVFASLPLNSFLDCTLGAAGHSAQIIQAHPEMKLYVGFDVDPVALEMAQARISGLLDNDSGDSISDLKVFTYLKNFKYIKSVLHDIDEKHLATGFHGILMDLGISSMQVNNAARGFSVLNDGPLDMRMNPQASLKAEDILNSWPDVEVGRILREYGEESNWYILQKKIVAARSTGGLHSTRELVELIRNSTSWTRGGRQGWIKTATRVFQALRIAVNDELNTLKDSIHSCFDTLASGGRLAIISFHSLEDRIVKQTFLNIASSGVEAVEERCLKSNSSKFDSIDNSEKEAWIKQRIQGVNATILTKRPITPSESEEKLNPRSRSAKLRVIQKV